MHNSRLADPLDPIAKELKAASSKRKKTEPDFLEMEEIEFRGGIYHDTELGPPTILRHASRRGPGRISSGSQ
jgi:hypothetical protein